MTTIYKSTEIIRVLTQKYPYLDTKILKTATDKKILEMASKMREPMLGEYMLARKIDMETKKQRTRIKKYIS